jgi:hypothetical protein
LILERATDHKCIIIAACQKKHQVWEIFQIQQSPIFREEEKLLSHGSSLPPHPTPLPPKNTALRLRCACRGVPFAVKGDASNTTEALSYCDGSELWETPARAYELGVD